MPYTPPLYDANGVHYSHAPRVPAKNCYPSVRFVRGDIFFITMSKYQDPRQTIDKYVLTLQDQVEFPNSPSVMVAQWSTKNLRANQYVSPIFDPLVTGLPMTSRVILDQLYTISRSLLNGKSPAGRITDASSLALIDQGLLIATGIVPYSQAAQLASSAGTP